jgi:hypothetical protein
MKESQLKVLDKKKKNDDDEEEKLRRIFEPNRGSNRSLDGERGGVNKSVLGL